MIELFLDTPSSVIKSVIFQGKTDRQLGGCVVFTQSKYQGFSSRVSPLGRHPFNIITVDIFDGE